jgi:Pectinacetylesterase
MDANETNPFGPGWNFVWLCYCDGSSQTSDLSTPLVFNNTALHLRGRAILDAILAELEAAERFLSTAQEVIFSGTSAGGVSTYLHASVVASRLEAPGARLFAVPDAGFFPDHGTMAPPHNHAWLASLDAAWAFWNATVRGDAAACAAAHADEPAKCLVAANLYPFSTVPHFILNSMMDTAGLSTCFEAECNPYKDCNASQTAAILEYAAELSTSITSAAAAFGDRDGYFVTSCYQHEESCRPQDWFGISIGGQTANSTFYNWYSGGPPANSRRVDVTWPGDASCAPQTDTTHGAC